MSKKFVDLPGLQAYHECVITALDDKANKAYISETQPIYSKSDDVWFDLSEEIQNGVEEVSLMSFEPTPTEELFFNEEEEPLTYNEDISNEDLVFNEEEEELTFNPEEEELTFNEDVTIDE